MQELKVLDFNDFFSKMEKTASGKKGPNQNVLKVLMIAK